MTEQPPRPPRPLESSAEPALAAWLRDETLALASLPSPSGTEGAVAERASALARTLGLEARPLRAGDGTLAALVVTPPGARGDTFDLVLCAHLDTVAPPPERVGPPLADDRWPARPYAGGGWVAGLGTLDDKGGAVCALAALALAAGARAGRGEGDRRAGDHGQGATPATAVVLTCDEEEGGSGSAAVAESLRLERAVVIEPTGLAVAAASAGALEAEVEFAGLAAHGSLPEAGDNAAERAARFVADLAKLPLAAAQHPLLGRARASCLEIKGGWRSLYTIPDRARVRVEVRLVPGCSGERAEAELRLAAARRGGRVEVLDRSDPWSCEGCELARALEQALARAGVEPRHTGMPSWTDGHNLVAGGCREVVVFGPGDLALAHTPTERVELRELVLATRALAELVRDVSLRGT